MSEMGAEHICSKTTRQEQTAATAIIAANQAIARIVETVYADIDRAAAAGRRTCSVTMMCNTVEQFTRVTKIVRNDGGYTVVPDDTPRSGAPSRFTSLGRWRLNQPFKIRPRYVSQMTFAALSAS